MGLGGTRELSQLHPAPRSSAVTRHALDKERAMNSSFSTLYCLPSRQDSSRLCLVSSVGKSTVVDFLHYYSSLLLLIISCPSIRGSEEEISNRKKKKKRRDETESYCSSFSRSHHQPRARGTTTKCSYRPERDLPTRDLLTVRKAVSNVPNTPPSAYIFTAKQERQ